MDRFSGRCLCGNVKSWRRAPHTGSAFATVSTAASIMERFFMLNLPEGMERAMRGFLHLTERNKTNLVRLARLLEPPAHAHVPRQSLSAIGRAFKGSAGGVIGRLLVFGGRCRETGP